MSMYWLAKMVVWFTFGMMMLPMSGGTSVELPSLLDELNANGEYFPALAVKAREAGDTVVTPPSGEGDECRRAPWWRSPG